MLRTALLWASTNPFLSRGLPRYAFVRRATRRFMPGETLDDALRAAEDLRDRGASTTLTLLGENVTTAAEADAVRDHYLRGLEAVRDRGFMRLAAVLLEARKAGRAGRVVLGTRFDQATFDLNLTAHHDHTLHAHATDPIRSEGALGLSFQSRDLWAGGTQPGTRSAEATPPHHPSGSTRRLGSTETTDAGGHTGCCQRVGDVRVDSLPHRRLSRYLIRLSSKCTSRGSAEPPLHILPCDARTGRLTDVPGDPPEHRPPPPTPHLRPG